MDTKKNKLNSSGISAMLSSVLSVFSDDDLEEEQNDHEVASTSLHCERGGTSILSNQSYLDLSLLRNRFQERLAKRQKRQLAWIEAENNRQLLEAKKDLEDPPEENVLEASQFPQVANQTEAITPIPRVVGDYSLPCLDLLNEEQDTQAQIIGSQEEIAKNRQIIQDTLDSFRIDAEVGDATYGPRVTLFEVTVARGVRVESILGLSKNLTMDLSASSLRILAPVPGQSYVGIEVPNRISQVVSLQRLLKSQVFQNSSAAIPLALGRNICNEDVILDLAKAPHLLIAGTTGSGKSVCLNAILMSLLYRFSPDELRLILVDPKVVEFSVYNTLPHLVCPVITESQNVALALRWVIREMEHRYKVLAQVGVRNLSAFNHRPKDDKIILDEKGEPIPEKFPFLVMIIDELADIMATSKNEVETSLARIAQLSRAVGIHTILATQRPSVNVITGTIKANYPCRIAFKVSSPVDSQTIINGKGAEVLLGRGDMLFFNGSAVKPERLQCPMVDDDEIQRVVQSASEQRPQQFDPTVTMPTQDSLPTTMGVGGKVNEQDDPLIAEAIEVIARDHRATTSYLQRRLKIGYNRAATLMEELEQRGIVGPQIGTAPREILIDEIFGE